MYISTNRTKKSPAHVSGGGVFQPVCRGDYQRESNESPMLNAFCLVAPSVLLSFLAILGAGVFLRAIDFSSRTCSDVHARLFSPFGMSISNLNI